MAHITLPEGLPGITGPLAFRPETAKPLRALAELPAPSSSAGCSIRWAPIGPSPCNCWRCPPSCHAC